MLHAESEGGDIAKKKQHKKNKKQSQKNPKSIKVVHPYVML